MIHQNRVSIRFVAMNSWLLQLALLAWILIALPQASQAEDTQQAASLFEQAVKLQDAGKFAEARKVYEKVLAFGPDYGTFLNAAQCAFLAGDPRDAVKVMEQLFQHYPDDIEATDRVIPMYSAAGDIAGWEAARKKFRLQWRSKVDPELSKRTMFLTDRFIVGERRVAVLEYFEPSGHMATYFKFNVIDPGTDLPRLAYALNLDHGITETGRNDGSLRPDESWFILDKMTPEAISIANGYKRMPDYAVLKQDVIDLINGKTKAREVWVPDGKGNE